MEINEFLKQNEVKFESTAKELDRMLKAYIDKNDYEKAFRKIAVTRSGESMTPKIFLNFVKDNEDRIKSIHSEVTDLRAAICYVISQVIANKEEFKKEAIAKRIVNSTSLPDYYIKNAIKDEIIEIFDIVDGKANEFDKDLYKCFCNAR